MNGEGGLAELWEYACAMDRLAAERPLRDVTFGGKWVVVRLEGGLCGRAFAFTGAHGVYGPLSLDSFAAMEPLVGRPAYEVFSWADCDAGRRMLGDILAGALAVAVLNAVSAACNRPLALAARGIELLDDCVAALVHPGDRVVVVGYGMFMPELRACGAEVDVVDLRPRCDLCTVQVGPSGVHRGPQGVAFHGPEATAGLFSEADVLFITGCTLVNRTFFDLMALPRRAREVVLFGPSGCAPFEALARSGVTCVAGTVVLDGGALVCSVLGEDVEPTVLRAAVQGYVAHLPPCRGACADRA